MLLEEEKIRWGMTNIAFGLLMPNGELHMLNDYPSKWQAEYKENSYINVDPTVKHGLQSVTPIMWSNEQLHTKEVNKFWEHAREFGLTTGCAQPVWDRQGLFSMLSISRDGLRISESEAIDKLSKLARWAPAIHAAMTKIIGPQEAPSTIKLTRVEKEVLTLIGTGDTSEKIADRLKVSARTVNWHIQNVMQKLNASNRVHAVVKAVQLGLIQL